MRLHLVWSKPLESAKEKYIDCSSDIDFEYCDSELWRLVQQGFVVSLAVVNEEK